MKFRFPLYAQIISVFVLNLVVLGCLLFAFFGRHTNFGWKNFLYGSISDRVQSMAMDIHWKLRSKPRDKWNSTLSDFGDHYGVKLAIFDSDGKQVAGEAFVLPEEIQAKITPPHFRLPAAPTHGFRPVPGVVAGGFTMAAPIAGATIAKAPIGIATEPFAGTMTTEPFAGTIATAPFAGTIATAPVPRTSGVRIDPAPGTFHVMTPPPGFAEGGFPFDAPFHHFVSSHHQRHHRPPHDGPPKFLFDRFMLGPPGPQPRFVINTKNPDRTWVGALLPLISPDTAPSTVEQLVTTVRPATGAASSSSTTTQTFHMAQLHRMPMPGILIAVTPNVWQTRLVSDITNLFLMIGGMFCISLIVWFPFVHQMTRALGKLTMATEEIADGKFDSVLTVKRWDEIGRLGSAINTMSSKLHAYVTGQKRFLGDIAHELCSPVARLQVGIELLESSSKPEQKATIQDIREEVEQMSMLINELLAFSKASVRGKETQLKSIDLTKILEETRAKIEAGCIVPNQTDSNATPHSNTNSNATPLSNTNSSLPNDAPHSANNATSLILNAQPGIYCLGDTILVKRALENILRNAVRYAGAFGPIKIDCTRNGDYAMISVVDCGPGVPEEAIESLGQPFYRPEESRSRSSGGVGLGLAIVKTCVEACNGSFSIRNMQPNGLRVDIILTASESSSQ